MSNVEAITQSRAQGSCQSPHKSISLHLGGSSKVFVKLSQCPGIPRTSKPMSLGNKLEEPDHQSHPLFDLTFDLTTSGIPLIAGAFGGQVIPQHPRCPRVLGVLLLPWYRGSGWRRDICKSPKRAHSMGARGLLSSRACTSPGLSYQQRGRGRGWGQPQQLHQNYLLKIKKKKLFKRDMFRQKTGHHSAPSLKW